MSIDQLMKVAKKYTTKLLLKQAEVENHFYWDQRDKFRNIYNALEEDLHTLKIRRLDGSQSFNKINELRASLLALWKEVDRDYPDDDLRNIVSWARGQHKLLVQLQEVLTSLLRSQHNMPHHKPIGIPLLLEWIQELNTYFSNQLGSNRVQTENSTLKPPAKTSPTDTPVMMVDIPKQTKLPNFS